LPDYASRFNNLTSNYLEPAAKMQELAQNQGIEITYYPSGPLLEYHPAKVTDPPTSTDELLAWADPKDPANGWTKTWAYLKELGRYVPTYPTKTSETMKNLANGTVDMIATTTGWDINPRALGQVPADMKISTLKGFHWVTDAHYAIVPKGITADKLSAILNLLRWMLTPEQQAKAYDKGYFYPGPAVKGVTLSMAPAASQQVVQQFGRPEYDQLIAANPKESSLPAAQQVAAFDMWDRGVGSPGAWLVWGVVAFFFLNLAAVVGVAVLLGTPAAYALARRDFPGKRLVTVLFLLPILLPPIAYGIPLATVLYKYHLAGTLAGVVLANLVPSVPFVILVMTPFIEQIDPRIESAARMSGAATHSVFLRVLGPLLVPGVLAAAILVLVRTVGMFELTFLTAGSDSQTLIVALFYSVNAAGIRAQQSTDVMAVVYTLTMLVLLVIALRFVNPTQLVSQIKEETTG